MVRGCPIRFYEDFWFVFPMFRHWWDVKTFTGDCFYLLRVLFPSSLNGSQVDPLCFIYLFIFICL